MIDGFKGLFFRIAMRRRDKKIKKEYKKGKKAVKDGNIDELNEHFKK